MDILDLAEFSLSQFPENLTLGEFKFLETTQEYITTRNDNGEYVISKSTPRL